MAELLVGLVDGLEHPAWQMATAMTQQGHTIFVMFEWRFILAYSRRTCDPPPAQLIRLPVRLIKGKIPVCGVRKLGPKGDFLGPVLDQSTRPSARLRSGELRRGSLRLERCVK
jgi:hypothetical protein